MPWEVEYTDEFGAWFDELTEEQQDGVHARVLVLQHRGPLLRRPLVGVIRSSLYAPQMKELICSEEGALRVLFMFDPRRTAILLLGGDKTGQWEEWYQTMVPEADHLNEQYLAELREEGLL